MDACHSRREIIVCFLALLELLRLHRIEVTQEERFGEIVVLAV
jgi:chromatin segregation and condensation protein Rec8/ScpA/Scc1 (kleisin family)